MSNPQPERFPRSVRGVTLRIGDPRGRALVQQKIDSLRASAALKRAGINARRSAQASTAARPARPEDLQRGKDLAMATFMRLHKERRALFHKHRRSAADCLILEVLIDRMPANVPDADADARTWAAFVGDVTATVAAIKNLPNQPAR